MKYIITGSAVGKVIQENRVRIARGEISFTPFVEAAPVAAAPVVAPQESPADEVEEPEVPEVPEVPEATDMPEVPEVPEVPVTDDKAAPEVEDTKEAPADDDTKGVEADADSKSVEAVDEKAPAAPKAKKSTGSSKK